MDVYCLKLEQQTTRDDEEENKGKESQQGHGDPVLVESEGGKDVIAAVRDAGRICLSVAGGTVVEVIGELVRAECTECKMLSP